MKTILETSRRTETDLEHEVSSFVFNITAVSAILIGLWALVCLISGFVVHGPLGMLKGYISAVTGM